MDLQEILLRLVQPARRRVWEMVCQKPGVSLSELARALDLSWTMTAIHVTALERAGLVESIRVGRRRVVYPKEDRPRSAVGILGEPACRRVALAVLHHPNTSVVDLCHLTRMSERAVYYHLKRLMEAGLIASAKNRGYRGLQASEELQRLLRPEP